MNKARPWELSFYNDNEYLLTEPTLFTSESLHASILYLFKKTYSFWNQFEHLLPLWALCLFFLFDMNYTALIVLAG